MSHEPTYMPPLPDYYEILQVHPKASQAVIKKAYRTLLLEMGHHPDQGGDPAVAALITEAYQVLGDPGRRAEYDEAYFGGPQTAPPPGGAQAGRAAPAQPPRHAAAASSLIVLCPRCRTKNRVRSQEVLDIAKCSKCQQKLSTMPGAGVEFLERVRGGLGRLHATLREAAKKPPRTGPGARRHPPRAIAVGVPLFLMAASGVAIWWTLGGEHLVADPVQTAERLHQQARHEEARRILREAIDFEPANTALHEKLGETCLKQKLYPEAAQHFSQAALHNPDNAHLRARLGRALYLQNDLDLAERAFKMAVQKDASYAPALFDLGNIHAKRQRYGEAAAYYEKALRYEPGADLYYNLGLVRKQDARPDQAIKAFKAALIQDPNHRASMVQLAELYNARGEFELAAAQYLTASQLKHQDVDLHLKLATIYENTGKTNLAIREWTTALAQGKDNPMIVERARRALTKLGAAPAS